MHDKKIRNLIFAALMAALTCIATIVVQLQSPFGGYVNLGDGFVLLSGFLLGPLYGSIAAGFGSGLADLLSGYTIYAPATFVIKLLVALIASILYKAFGKSFASSNNQKNNSLRKQLFVIAASFAGECVMVAGYFVYAIIIGNGGTALAGIPGNLVQAVIGIVLAAILKPLLGKVGIRRIV